MPEESKKHNGKSKHEPKEQRKPRQGRHTEKKVEKNQEKVNSKDTPKITQIEPPPEFYQNLKRETDDILKITEEENSKYKKKEIQSNWSKYEMPIESYEEIEEQESMGADYEQLIQSSLAIGGHFQFKHEKSWDMSSAPSLYDKYFDIISDDLSSALCSIPFYERNCIDPSLFSEAEIITMKNRTSRHKQFDVKENKKETNMVPTEKHVTDEDDNDIIIQLKPETNTLSVDENKLETLKKATSLTKSPVLVENATDVDIDDIIIKNISIPQSSKEPETKQDKVIKGSGDSENEDKPVLESPEDLEKWLDDLLDG